MVHALVQYLGAQSIEDLAVYGIDNITDLVDLVSRVGIFLVSLCTGIKFMQFTTNAFAVTDPSLTPIGVCISPTVALFNHSCEPNAVLVFPRSESRSKKDEPMVGVVTVKDIAANEEVSFVNPLLDLLTETVNSDFNLLHRLYPSPSSTTRGSEDNV